MRYLTTAAMALVLAASAAGAGAQPSNATDGGDHASRGGAPGGQYPGGPAPAAPRAGPPAGPQSGRSIGGPPPAGGQGNASQSAHGNYHGPTVGVRGPNPYVPPSGFMVGPQGHAGVYGAGAHPGVFNGPGRGGVPGANHPLRGRDSGRAWYNPGVTPPHFTAQRRFHADWSYRPYGWYARSWVYGDFLPAGWFGQAYYLDWNGFGLPAPPIGCEWVREGNDALLVDAWSGQVLSVDYGVFW